MADGVAAGALEDGPFAQLRRAHPLTYLPAGIPGRIRESRSYRIRASLPIDTSLCEARAHSKHKDLARTLPKLHQAQPMQLIFF